MQVIALSNGFYQGARRRTGAIFEMEPGKDGKLPKWVKAAHNVAEAKAEAAKAKKAEQDKQRAGAIAASGGTAAKAKNDAAAELAG